ncbi:glycosyltransferase [Pseudomonas sp. Lz4W]|uniref:glycosyltransferase n=1 Tax=Pseudomonas sp. Lz4W TaxID=1206777 RepID=UPI000346B78E|nr:glycosyltransferase [Pseudomonas sp. Lz4W]NBF16493.1 glycosyltransferase [Pseudomonas sp. Fl4BN2]
MSGLLFDRPNNIQIISVLNKLSSQSGGVTRVSLARAKSLAERGFRSIIATVEYDPLLLDSIKALRSDERLGSTVGILNFFIYFAKLSRAGVGAGALSDYFADPEGAEFSRRSRYVGISGLRSNEYLNSEGWVFAREIVDATGEVVSIQLDIPGRELVNFLTRDDAYIYWLDEVSSYGEFTIFIADASSRSDAVSKVTAVNARTVLTLHGNHFARPFVFGSEVTGLSGKIISNARFCDALVVLTDAQRVDLVNQFPSLNNLAVIPNSVSKDTPPPLTRSGNTFVVVSRLESVKNIELVIRAFKIALAKNNSLCLDIWGHGSRGGHIQALIDASGMSEQVVLRGYANPVSEVFVQARASLSASVSEGFGLSILESMAFGCPVISLSSNYGPVELIKNGVNGYLVGDEQEMAEKILGLAADDVNHASMSSAGVETADEHSPSKVADKWVSLIHKLTAPEWRAKTASGSVSIRNAASSVGGNIILTSYTKEELSIYRRLLVVRVDRSKKVGGAACLIEPGVYNIHHLQFEDDGRVLLKFAQGANVYKGVVPRYSVEFKLLS